MTRRTLRAAILLVLLAWAAPVSAAITLTQAWSGNSGSGLSVAKAYLSATTAGSLLIVACGSGDIGTTVTTPTDTQSNVWTIVNKVTRNAAIEASLWYLANAPGGALTVTCNFGGSTFSNSIAVGEYSGAATSSPLDVQNTGNGFGTAVSTTAITPSFDNDLLVGVVMAGTNTFTPGTSYTERLDNGAARAMEIEDRIITSITTYDGGPSWAVNAAADWAAVLGAFKAGAGGCKRTLLGVGCAPAPDDPRPR